MLTGGRILHHLKSKLPDEKSGVLFVGYQVEGTKGALLKNGLMTINFHHKPVNVEAEIFSIDSMSAHADSDDLVEWVRKISNKPKKIFLNHGSPSSAHAMQYRLKYELNLPEPVVPIEGQEFDL
jgi:metallo-beta-lactamase family protein